MANASAIALAMILTANTSSASKAINRFTVESREKFAVLKIQVAEFNQLG